MDEEKPDRSIYFVLTVFFYLLAVGLLAVVIAELLK